jgi:hypothetical protein
MKFGELFEKWGIKGLTIKTPILEIEWSPQAEDKDAAWEQEQKSILSRKYSKLIEL